VLQILPPTTPENSSGCILPPLKDSITCGIHLSFIVRIYRMVNICGQEESLRHVGIGSPFPVILFVCWCG
jgi:hypothetical protein